ncbi:MAG: EAL domain-containing protein [Arenimonas sp.]
MAQSVAKIGSWNVDVETMTVTWSDENYRIYDVDPATIQPRCISILDHLSPEDAEIKQRLFDESLATGQSAMIEHRVTLPDGRLKYVEERWRVVMDSAGLPLRVIGTCQDITERKQAELALASSEIRLRSIIDNEPECVKLLAEDGSLLEMNPAGLRMIEAESIEEVKNHTLYPLVVEEYRHAFRELNQQVFAGGSGKLEFEVVGLKGGRRWLDTHASPLRDSSGKVVALLGISRDITERKKALGVLEASELQQRNMVLLLETERARLVAAQRVSKVGSWETDLLNSAVTWSEETHHIHETDPSIFHPTHEGFLALIHPADRQAVEAAFNQSFDQHFDQQHDHVAEHRLLLAEGRIKYLEERWQIVFDAEGKPARAIGTCQDVTDRKQAELKIKGLNRVYAVLSQINSLIVRASDRGELFKEACRIVVESGGFRMAMIGILDRATNKVVPVATAGKDEQLLTGIRSLLSSDEKAPSTMVAKAIRDKTVLISNDMEHDLRNLLREDYSRAGVRSLAVLPLLVSGEAVGILALYAKEKDFFHDEEMQLLTELASDVAFAVDHIDQQERLELLASYDPLTGLANRRLLLERLTQFMGGAADNGHKLALLLIDLERFKNINDTLGQPAGDALLQQVAEWLRQHLGDANRVARVGPDQFAFVLQEDNHAGDASRQLEAMIETFLGHQFVLNGDMYRIAAKFGVAVFPDDGTDADILYKNAEAALKKAKVGGHRHLFYTPKMTETVALRLKLENKLRRALENDEFVLHYQPKVSLDSGEVTSVEALIRWNDPLTGLVPPGLFIPTLEETGLISEVGRWALQKSLEDYLRWRAAGLKAVRVAVNVSPLQFRHPGFIASLRQIVATDEHAAEGLELEITEGIIMGDMQQAIASLQAIRELGISIAIDDFGTGFSSLGYLSKLPIDTLKIDRMFVTDMVANSRGLSLVSTIINLGHSLKLKVVAEGVETEEQSKLLRLLKCDEMQGYLFSRPIPVEALEEKFLKRLS